MNKTAVADYLLFLTISFLLQTKAPIADVEIRFEKYMQ